MEMNRNEDDKGCWPVRHIIYHILSYYLAHLSFDSEEGVLAWRHRPPDPGSQGGPPCNARRGADELVAGLRPVVAHEQIWELVRQHMS